MKKQKLLIVILLVLVIPFQQLIAQDIISAADLAKAQKSGDLVLVSVRSTSDYQKVHITGAVHIDLNTLYKEGPVASMLKPAGDIATILGDKGISESKKIVIYDDGTGKNAGRMYWILDYLGAQDVKILDGAMNAWRAARKPVTKNPTKVTTVTFTPKPDNSKLATMADVKKAQGNANAVIVDARSAAEFNGTDAATIKQGHIPGAINLEFSNVLTKDGKLKSNAELKALFDKAGITADKEIILYCKSSVRAGIVYMALKSALNYPKVKVYDGAFLEWQADNANKVEV